MEYWKEDKKDIAAVFKKINSESDYMELYELFREMGFETEGMAFTGVCFSLPAEFYRKIADQNMQELLRFSIFQKIQEYVKKTKNGFVIRRDTNSSNLIILSYQDGAEEQIRKCIGQIQKSDRSHVVL